MAVEQDVQHVPESESKSLISAFITQFYRQENKIQAQELNNKFKFSLLDFNLLPVCPSVMIVWM